MPTKDKELARKYRRDWYYRNREKSIQAVAQRVKELREWFREYKSTLACEKCDENHWSCLEFHHPDPTMKEFTAAQMISKGFSKARILREIEGLVVLCANCHRKIHFP